MGGRTWPKKEVPPRDPLQATKEQKHTALALILGALAFIGGW